MKIGLPLVSNPGQDKYLDFKPYHPLAHKVAVAWTLFNGAEKICTALPDSEKDKEHVANALQINGYPRGLVVKTGHLHCSYHHLRRTHPQPQ